MQALSLAAGQRPCLGARRPAPRAGRRPAPMVRSVLEINKPAGSSANGAAQTDIPSELERELKYRLATKSTDNDKLYQSGAHVGGRRGSSGGWRCSPPPLCRCLRRLQNAR